MQSHMEQLDAEYRAASGIADRRDYKIYYSHIHPFPLLVLGLWYSLKHRLRQVSPIIVFTSMLTLAYSLFQGNVGTAYRQRSQLLVFYFIFVAVGAVIVKERAEDKRRQQQLAKVELAELQAARVLARRRAS